MYMKTMRSLIFALTVIFLLTSPALCKQFKLVSSFPTTAPVGGESYLYFIEQVDKLSNGQVKFKFFEPGKLVPANAVLDNVSKGLVAAGITASSYHAGKMPSAPMFMNFPFGPEQPERIAWLYSGNGIKLWQELYDNAGFNVIVLPMVQIPHESGGWFAKPVNSIDDFKGLKMRAGGLCAKVLTRVGVSVTFMPMGDVFTALERGVLDAVEFSYPSIDAKLGFSKVLKYNYFPSWHTPASTTELLINKDVWEKKFNENQRMLIQTVAKATVLQSMAIGEATQAAVIKANATEKGVKNMKYSNEILQKLKAAWQEVVKEECANDPMFNKIWADLSAFRSEYAVWKQLSSIPDLE